MRLEAKNSTAAPGSNLVRLLFYFFLMGLIFPLPADEPLIG